MHHSDDYYDHKVCICGGSGVGKVYDNVLKKRIVSRFPFSVSLFFLNCSCFGMKENVMAPSHFPI